MESSQIPIVDFGPVLQNPDLNLEQWSPTVKALDSALSSIGFVYLVNHGIPAQAIEEGFAVARTFFQLPPEVKSLYTKRFSSGGAMEPADYNGYVPAGYELLDKSSHHEIRESFDVMGPVEGRVYPSQAHAPNFELAIVTLRAHFVELAVKLSQALALALLGPGPEHLDFFKDRLKGLTDPGAVSGLNPLRLLYYPKIPIGAAPATGTGITRCFQHSDYGMLTFLAQDGVGGLEVKHVQGDWVPAPPVEGALLVNTGDLLQFWSGGHYPATVHRVRILECPFSDTVHAPARQSIAFFVNPDDDVNVAPLKTKFSEDQAPASSVNALEYVMQRLKTAYSKV